MSMSCQLLNLLVCLYCFLSTTVLLGALAEGPPPLAAVSASPLTPVAIRLVYTKATTNKQSFFYNDRAPNRSRFNDKHNPNSIFYSQTQTQTTPPIYQFYQVFSSQSRVSKTPSPPLHVNEYANLQQRMTTSSTLASNDDAETTRGGDGNDATDASNASMPGVFKRSIGLNSEAAKGKIVALKNEMQRPATSYIASNDEEDDAKSSLVDDDDNLMNEFEDSKSLPVSYNLTGQFNSSYGNATNSTGPKPPTVGQIIVKVIMVIIYLPTIMLTLLGNMLVIFAIVIVKRLHTQDNASNFLIVSLAVSDMLVGVLAMPFALYVELSPENEWRLSAWICDLWTMSDVLLCAASILNLCAISIDRYFIILHAMVYTQRRNAKLMLLMILAVWLLSATISIPPLFGWGKPSETLKTKKICAVSEDIRYQIYATFFSFYLPLITMIIIYLNIYRAARKIKKREMDTAGRLKVTMGTIQSSYLPDSMNNIKSQTELLLDSEHTQTAPNEHTSSSTKTKKSSKKTKVSLKNAVSEHGSFESKAISISSGDTANSEMKQHRLSVNLCQSSILLNSPNHHSHHNQNGGHVTVTAPQSSAGSRRGSFGRRVGRRLTNVFKRNSNASGTHGKNQKATRTLGIIMGCFTLCWLPFFILAVLKPIPIGNSKNFASVLPRWLDAFLLWLGYFNSALNPLIYARTNREFRKPFIEIICCRCRGINEKLRDEERRKMYNDELNSTTRRLSMGFNTITIGSSRNSMNQPKRLNPSLNELSEEVSFEKRKVGKENSNSLNHAESSIYQSVSSEPTQRARPHSTGADFDDGERRISSEEISKQLRSLKYKFFDVKYDEDSDNIGSSSAVEANDKTGFSDYLELTKLVKLSEIDYFKSSDPDYSFTTIISKPSSSQHHAADQSAMHVTEKTVEYFVLKEDKDGVELACGEIEAQYSNGDEHRLSNDDTIKNEESVIDEDESNDRLYENDDDDDDVDMTCSDIDKAFNQNSKKFLSFESARSFFENSIPPSKSMPNYRNDMNANSGARAETRNAGTRGTMLAEEGSYGDENEIGESTKLLNEQGAARQESTAFQFSLNSIPNSSVYSFTTALTSPTSIRTNSSLQSPVDPLNSNVESEEVTSPREQTAAEPDTSSKDASRQKKLLNYTTTKHQSMDHAPAAKGPLMTSTTTSSFLQQNAPSPRMPPTSASYNAQLASLAQPQSGGNKRDVYTGGVLKPKKNKISSSSKLSSHDLPEQILEDQCFSGGHDDSVSDAGERSSTSVVSESDQNAAFQSTTSKLSPGENSTDNAK